MNLKEVSIKLRPISLRFGLKCYMRFKCNYVIFLLFIWFQWLICCNLLYVVNCSRSYQNNFLWRGLHLICRRILTCQPFDFFFFFSKGYACTMHRKLLKENSVLLSCYSCQFLNIEWVWWLIHKMFILFKE